MRPSTSQQIKQINSLGPARWTVIADQRPDSFLCAKRPLKFTPRGGQVRVTVTPLAENIEITVEDSGRGIATQHLPHIFDRFYRVPGSGTSPTPEQGLGLGLSFVAWIVKAHNGKIDVDSTPGKGTKFTITLRAAGVGSDTMELAQPAALT